MWGVGSLFNSCTCSTLSHFKVRGNEIVGGGIGGQIQSRQFYPSHFLPHNSGKCNCRGWGVICVQNYNISSTCGKSNYLLPPQNSRKCRCGVLVVCSIHAHVQHLTHLRQSDLRVFSFYFPCPTSRFGKIEIVGGGIGCQIQSLQFYPSHFLPQNSGKNVIVGAGVSYLCKITSRAPGASPTTFSSFVVFLFPPQNSRKCRCGVLVVGSIHAHVQHLMQLRQSGLHVFSLYFPCFLKWDMENIN